jgi:hypothetical protein
MLRLHHRLERLCRRQALARLFAASMRGVHCLRLARAGTMSSGMLMLRAIARRPMPEAKAVLICSQDSLDIWRHRFACT